MVNNLWTNPIFWVVTINIIAFIAACFFIERNLKPSLYQGHPASRASPVLRSLSSKVVGLN
jgi:hypothetical protein